MQQIGPYKLANNLFLAPMVGVSDTPFREICMQQGAGLTIGEMLTSNSELWHNERNRLKQVKPRIGGPQVVQIAGSEPAMMAEAARLNAQRGATAIDINMGCPAKKVLKKAAGSALLKEPDLVRDILQAVVAAVTIPVTLKIRTGWSAETRNGVDIARIAEDCGIQLLTVHGRTREDRFNGHAEYDTIAEIKQSISIPVIANGDIDSPRKAKQVLLHTGADGLMIGRAAQGHPWLFREVDQYLRTNKMPDSTSILEQLSVIDSHLKKLHRFYGETKGVWYARKHVSGYVKKFSNARPFLQHFNQLQSGEQQRIAIARYFHQLTDAEGAMAA